MSKYKPIIGLEVHVELKTKSKMFCGCSADYFGKKPNTHTCPVCLGLPGALPVPNKTAIEWCVMIGLALNCKIPLFSKFDRKNYFYPDLPKGYQISQYDQPFCINGCIELNSSGVKLFHLGGVNVNSKKYEDGKKRIRIRRVHMEEDTAKLIHQFGISNDQFPISNKNELSLIDFNRSGVPLVEIVTEPDFESAEEVVEYLKKLQQIVRYLHVSNADMEKGDMRLEPNISLRQVSLRGDENDEAISRDRHANARDDKFELPSYKVEVKNINSFKFVDKAIQYELKRQAELLESGQTPLQETRGWNEAKQKTISQRTKEEAHDYRYFPEPDIPPFRWSSHHISTLKDKMPELPDRKLARFQENYKLSKYDSELLTRDKETASYFEEAVKVGHTHLITPKQIANFIINKKPNIFEVLPAGLVQQIVSSKQIAQIDYSELENIIKNFLETNKKAVEDFKKGKQNAIMFLIGQVMKSSKQKLDAILVKEKIVKAIQNL